MLIVSAYSEENDLLTAVTNQIMERNDIGKCTIVRTPLNYPLLLARDEENSFGGYFVPCYSEREALELAGIGIPILDIDRILNSMNLVCVEEWTGYDEFETMDYLIANEVIYRLYKFMRERIVAEFLPTKTITVKQPVLDPNNF